MVVRLMRLCLIPEAPVIVTRQNRQRESAAR
jgi:hypothetical protein